MSTLPDINILPTSSGFGTPEGLKSGNSKGNGIFQSILDNLNGRGSDRSWVSALYSDNSGKSSFNSGAGSKHVNLNGKIGLLGKKPPGIRLHKNSRNPEDLVVPASLQNQLIAFLEKQGFSLKDINQVLSASKDSNGSIRLDKALAGLSGISSGDNATAKKQGLMLVTSFKDLFSSFLSEQEEMKRLLKLSTRIQLAFA